MKPTIEAVIGVSAYVAEWIETNKREYNKCQYLSQPMWLSGLKHLALFCSQKTQQVSAYVAEWIETLGYNNFTALADVSAYVAEWIETSKSLLE